jgi:formylglycine-generating enzyme required for sulfatase activity
MTYEVTNEEYLTYLQTGLQQGFVYIDSSGEVYGYFPGDEFLPQGSYLYYILNSTSARIFYDNGAFSIDPGYEQHPVTNISWFGAYSFATFWGMTLPTEYEWEKAARGATGFQYPWGNTNPNCDLANYRNCVLDVQEVGVANGVSPFGCYDMAGNVMEWTTSPAAGGNSRISRGGNWDANANALTTYWRNNSTANGLNHRSGFRCIVRP